MPELETLKVRYRDDRGRARKLRVWADPGCGYRGDFRAFADVGGGREALKAPGAPWATTDLVEAETLAKRRVDDLLARRQARRDGRPLDDPRLADYVETYLAWKKDVRGHTATLERGTPKIAASTLDRDRLSLENLLQTLGTDVRLSAIDKRHISAHIRRRRADDRAEQTILNEIHTFSGLWAHAKAEDLVRGDNPVPAAKTLERLEPPDHEAEWLEMGEAVRLLDAARAMDADPAARFLPCLYPVLATFLLTGGRKREVLGLERRDVDRDAGYIYIRPNRWRALKSPHSRRSVPLWPQLQTIIEEHLARLPASRTLLFPSYRHRTERPYVEIDVAVAAAVERAKIEKPVTLHTLRHTYASHRLYTLDRGAPVSVWDVACELGHHETDMIERVYGHVLRDRDRRGPRGDQVRYETAKVLPLAAANA